MSDEFEVPPSLSLSESLNTSTTAGKMVFAALEAAGLERSLIAERMRAGLRNARAKGKRFGRPKIAADRTPGCRATEGKPFLAWNLQTTFFECLRIPLRFHTARSWTFLRLIRIQLSYSRLALISDVGSIPIARSHCGLPDSHSKSHLPKLREGIAAFIRAFRAVVFDESCCQPVLSRRCGRPFQQSVASFGNGCFRFSCFD